MTSTIVGGMTGRLVAGQVADAQGWRSGLAAVAIITAIASIAIARGFPEVDNQSAARRDPRGVPPAVWALASTAFLLMGGFFTLYTYAGFHLTGSLGVSTADASWVFMCYGMGLVAAPLAGRLAARVNRLTLFVLGSATTIAGAVTTLSSLLPIVVAGFAIATAGFFFAHTTAAGWVAAAAGGGPRASALYALAYYSGAGLCAWLAGYVFESAGWGATVVTVSTATVCACACAYVAARLAAGTHDVVAQTQATSPPRRPR